MNRTKKLLALGMIVLSLSFVYPQKARAQYVDVANAIKEYVADPIMYYVINVIIQHMVSQTVNWINSGFQGNPAYVTNPGQFFLNIGDTVAGRILSENGFANQLCTPFRAQVRLALVRNYLSQNENFACSLSTLRNNFNQFIQDFSVGGWNGWFEVTQNDSANPYGSFLEAQNQLSLQVGTQQNKYQNQLNWGKGVFSFEVCRPGTQYTAADEANGIGRAGDCFPGDKETATPGTVIETTLAKTLGSGVDRLVAADEIDEIIGALFNQLISRVIGGVGNGLRGASQPDAGGQTYTTDIANEPQQQPSNPNAGQVTGGGQTCTTGAPTTSCVTEPDTVDPITGIVTPGQMNCTTVSGSQTCTQNPVVMPPIVIPGSGGGPGVPPPVDALARHPDQSAVVAQVIRDLQAQGVSLVGCGAFQVTMEVARRLGGGAGLLDKPTGANCQGYASDIIVYPDGYIYDILFDSGGANGPQWIPSGCGTDGTCAIRYRPAI